MTIQTTANQLMEVALRIRELREIVGYTTEEMAARTGVTEEQYSRRMLLRETMLRHGFRPLAEEWWHFTLENEPWPDTYFTFPVRNDYNH